MRVLSVGAILEPGHEIETRGSVEVNRVTVEFVKHQCQIPVGGKLVGHELAVLPDADDIGQVKDALALMRLAWGRSRQIGVPFSGDLDKLAGRLSA